MELSSALRLDKSFAERLISGGQSQAPAIRIGIVGCGSRGLTVLERLCALAGKGERRVEIRVFDPHRPGPGLHSVEQPAYLMLNTVASQISMFPDQAALDGLSGRQGPNFYEWCLRFKSAERAIRPDEFLPRQWLGEYLAWTYDEVLRTLPDQVSVTHYARVVDNIEHTDLGGFAFSTVGGQTHSVDWLLITVGHAEAPPAVNKTQAMTNRLCAYPHPFSLESISSTDTVGVEGLGLSAMDVVAGLTVGRGGRFVERPEGLRYEPSGREPQVMMYSRSGLPYRTRPDIAPHRTSSPPLIFTLSTVADLRAQHPNGLDFEAQVLPVLKAEMFAEYFGIVASLKGESALRVKSEVATAFLLGEIDSKARALAQQFDVPLLDESVFNRSLRADVDNYSQFVREFIEEDLRESISGLDHSPVKAAVEVWRSCREQLRRVVDNNGLTPESHRIFFNEYAPLVNRMVAGPQKERHQELLALVDAGIVQWLHYSKVIHNPETGDVSIQHSDGSPIPLNALVCAHVSDSRRIESQPKIILQLRNSGVLHSLNDQGEGIHVDSHGKAQPNLWITGPIVEGATYYNHYVPSSGSYSRAFVDADRIAREMLGLAVTA